MTDDQRLQEIRSRVIDQNNHVIVSSPCILMPSGEEYEGDVLFLLRIVKGLEQKLSGTALG